MSNPNNGLKQFDFVIVDRKYVGSIIKLWTPQTNTFEIKYRDNSGRKLCESVKPDRIIQVPNEIEKFYATGLATDAEQVFFDTLLQQYRSNTSTTSAQTQEFVKHIHDIETKYHPDQQGKFAQLWPEISSLL